jgi:hypothetical protein
MERTSVDSAKPLAKVPGTSAQAFCYPYPIEKTWVEFVRICEPDTRALMQQARPCRCSSTDLLPVSDCDKPPIIAIACEDCGEIEGDAPTLAQAVPNWNLWAAQ